MNKRIHVIALLMTVVLSLTVVVAQGSHFSKRIILEPTSEGEAVNARGRAMIEMSDRGLQRLRVQISADVPDGATYNVWVSHKTPQGIQDEIHYLCGTITISEGFGQMVLYSEEGALPRGVDPVTELGGVAVTEPDKTMILYGEF